MRADAPPASQRRSTGTQADANDAMLIIWNESVPPENFVQSTPPPGNAPSRKDGGGGSISADLVERIVVISQ